VKNKVITDSELERDPREEEEGDDEDEGGNRRGMKILRGREF